MGNDVTAMALFKKGARFGYANGQPVVNLDKCDLATRAALVAEIERRTALISARAKAEQLPPHKVRLASFDPCPVPHRPHPKCMRRGSCEICGDEMHAARGGTCPLCVAALRRCDPPLRRT